MGYLKEALRRNKARVYSTCKKINKQIFGTEKTTGEAEPNKEMPSVERSGYTSKSKRKLRKGPFVFTEFNNCLVYHSPSGRLICNKQKEIYNRFKKKKSNKTDHARSHAATPKNIEKLLLPILNSAKGGSPKTESPQLRYPPLLKLNAKI